VAASHYTTSAASELQAAKRECDTADERLDVSNNVAPSCDSVLAILEVASVTTIFKLVSPMHNRCIWLHLQGSISTNYL
jgi:hypothetical protein